MCAGVGICCQTSMEDGRGKRREGNFGDQAGASERIGVTYVAKFGCH